MNTNIKITLTDEQRVLLQQQLTGKNKPISRAELTTFVNGVLHGAMDCEQIVNECHADSRPNLCFEPRTDLTELPAKWDAAYADKPDHWRQGWLRGWNLVGRAVGSVE